MIKTHLLIGSKHIRHFVENTSSIFSYFLAEVLPHTTCLENFFHHLDYSSFGLCTCSEYISTLKKYTPLLIYISISSFSKMDSMSTMPCKKYMFHVTPVIFNTCAIKRHISLALIQSSIASL